MVRSWKADSNVYDHISTNGQFSRLADWRFFCDITEPCGQNDQNLKIYTHVDQKIFIYSDWRIVGEYFSPQKCQ